MRERNEVGRVERKHMGFCPLHRAGELCKQSLEQCYCCLNYSYCYFCGTCQHCKRTVRRVPDFSTYERGQIRGRHEILALAQRMRWPMVTVGTGKKQITINNREEWLDLMARQPPPIAHEACWVLCDLLSYERIK